MSFTVFVCTPTWRIATVVRTLVTWVKTENCRQRQAPVMQQKMASLPEDCITPSKPPFTYVGVDCFAPFLVRQGRATAKRYGVLFTSLAIRAVHIEVVHSMDTESLSMLYIALFPGEDVQKKLG